MKDKNKFFEWIVVIIVATILLVVAGKVSDILDINRRSARYLILVIVGLVYWIIDMIRSKKS